MPTVTFTKEKKQIDVPEGTDLRSAARKSGVNVYDGLNGFGAALNALVNCHGLGMCHTCRVSITKGRENISPLTIREKIGFNIPIPPPPLPNPIPACLYYIGHEDTLRLACMTKVYGDVEVETGPQLDFCGENFFS